MTDEEKQAEFDRKADSVAKEGIGCCLVDAALALTAFSLLLVPALLLIG